VIRTVPIRVLRQILLVIVSAEAGITNVFAQLCSRTLSFGRLPVDDAGYSAVNHGAIAYCIAMRYTFSWSRTSATEGWNVSFVLGPKPVFNQSTRSVCGCNLVSWTPHSARRIWTVRGGVCTHSRVIFGVTGQCR